MTYIIPCYDDILKNSKNDYEVAFRTYIEQIFNFISFHWRKNYPKCELVNNRLPIVVGVDETQQLGNYYSKKLIKFLTERATFNDHFLLLPFFSTLEYSLFLKKNKKDDTNYTTNYCQTSQL